MDYGKFQISSGVSTIILTDLVAQTTSWRNIELCECNMRTHGTKLKPSS